MEKLNVRFPKSIVDDLAFASSKFNVTASKVARDAMALGLGIMSSNGAYVAPDEYLKSAYEIECEVK